METESVIRDGYLHSDDYPAPLAIPSAEWQSWLERNKKFKFETARTSFTAFKDSRGYWVAQKRVGGLLRQKRLGNSQTLAKIAGWQLTEISQNLCSLHENSKNQGGISEQAAQKIVALEQELDSWKIKYHEVQCDRDHEIAKLIKIHTEIDKDLIQDFNEQIGEAVSILEQALRLKPNAGGAIKQEIKKAIQKLKDCLLRASEPERPLA